MDKKGFSGFILNPKTLGYTAGGALIGYLIFNKFEAALIGGFVGFVISFKL